MRTVEAPQISFGEIDISMIKLDPKSRDDIPAILAGLQYIVSLRQHSVTSYSHYFMQPPDTRIPTSQYNSKVKITQD